MPINFGILQSPVDYSQKPIGSGTSTSTTDSGPGLANDIGSGLSSFADAYSKKRALDINEATANQSIAASKQDMEMRQMEIDAKRHGQAVQGQIDDSYKTGGFKAVIETMRQNGQQKEAFELLKQQQEFRDGLVGGKKKVSELNEQEVKSATARMSYFGNGVSAIEAHKTPEEKEAAYQQLKPEIEKSTGMKLPENYNPALGLMAMHTVVTLKDQIEKNPYLMKHLVPADQKDTMDSEIKATHEKSDPNAPPIEKLNDYLTKLNARKDELIKAGGDTSAIDADIQRAQAASPGKAGFWDNLKAAAGTEAGKILGAVVPQSQPKQEAPVDDLDQQAKDAIARGADPKAVQARLEQLRNAK